jgi:hypothetical protein
VSPPTLVTALALRSTTYTAGALFPVLSSPQSSFALPCPLQLLVPAESLSDSGPPQAGVFSAGGTSAVYATQLSSGLHDTPAGHQDRHAPRIMGFLQSPLYMSMAVVWVWGECTVCELYHRLTLCKVAVIDQGTMQSLGHQELCDQAGGGPHLGGIYRGRQVWCVTRLLSCVTEEMCISEAHMGQASAQLYLQDEACLVPPCLDDELLLPCRQQEDRQGHSCAHPQQVQHDSSTALAQASRT